MAESPFRTLIANIKDWPLSRKLALAGVALLSLVFFLLIILQANKAEYRPLYTGLARQEAASVTGWLKEQGVPYDLKDNGQAIYVPAGMVYETRLNLAGAGLPKQGGMGFEIFDQQSFGVTKFTQKINYQRALQGELARTITALDAVKSARVHLVLPEERLLQDQQEQAKASVVIDLAEGRALDMTRTQGIIHLVAGSIEGLNKGQVTVVDTSGRTLSQNSGQEQGQIMFPDKLKFKTILENRLENRAQSLLDRALGQGSSVVRVTAELDFTREAITREEYDPDSLVPRSEQLTESESGSGRSGGIPGVESNLGGGSSSNSGPIPSRKSSEIVNYEINKTVKRINSPVGQVEKISAAVLVAEKIKPGANGEPGSPVPLTPEKIESIRRMVVSAIGLDLDRGDRIEVVSMPFEKKMLEGKAGELAGPAAYDYIPYAKYALLLFLAVLLYFVLIRPLVKTLRVESAGYYTKTVTELEDEFASEQPALDSPARLRRELANSSVTPTQVIKTWLKEG
ncbi:MAG: flagellar M-ring protein FliF [Desulfohalobiaceae bacterium]|nr:flagellar M-ring protein FliF [Desulfohalobiaceae bacterium]